MSFRRIASAVLVLSLSFSPLQAQNLPELGDVAGSELSAANEKRIGQQIMHQIRWQDASYLDDPDVETYLMQLGGRLAAVSDDPGIGFQFFAINDPSINAFAMPGGFIGVHTGLILAAQSESELAGVLAHEISHVTQRHIARQLYQSNKVSIASMLAMGVALLAGHSSGQAAGAAIVATQAGAVSAQLAYSRDFEREADRQGFEIMRRSGFEVRGMSAFFQRLQKAMQLYESNATAYLRTHPLSGERMTDMQNRELSQPYHQVADSADFHLVRVRLRAMQGIPSEAIRDFQGLLQDRKYSSEAAAHYGLGVAYGRAKDWDAAERETRQARKLGMASPIIEHQLAEIRLARGDGDGGLALYREAIGRYPTHMGLLYCYGNALIGVRRYEDALRFTALQIQNYPQDVRFYRMQAESYAGLGRRAQQHRALAESYALQGETAEALQQLQFARAAGDADFYELSAIDARLRELKLRERDELKEKRN